MNSFALKKWIVAVSFFGMLAVSSECLAAGVVLFNVKDYGATGKRADDARAAIQKAIDACAAAGGGMVYLPPGEYSSGSIHLRSHVRLHIEAGSRLIASPDPTAYDYGQIPSKAALIYGEDLEDISIEGRGIVDGQAEYEWRPDDFERGYNHKIMMEKLGKSLMRSFPKGFPPREVFPHLVWLGNCKDAHISGLTFLHSPSWTMALYACERMVIDSLYIYTSSEGGGLGGWHRYRRLQRHPNRQLPHRDGGRLHHLYLHGLLGPGASLREYHRHQLRSVFGLCGRQVQRGQQARSPEYCDRQLRDLRHQSWICFYHDDGRKHC